MSFFGYSVYNKYKEFIMLAVGIDIGGTSIKGAVVNELGEASEMFSLTVIKSDGQERIIEKTAENLYRTINQRTPSLPASNHAVKQKVSFTKNIDLTPQESEQLSQYAADDQYVQQQKEDIQELATFYRDMMDTEEEEEIKFVNDLKRIFTPQAGINGSYKIVIDNGIPLTVIINGKDLNCYYGDADKYDVEVTCAYDCMNEIVSGRMTFQRAFMAGNMTLTGDFRLLRNLDIVFPFGI